MLEIDGSSGEGGGQIIRTAISLSAIKGLPVRIKNIRANRPNPGLAAQHLKAIETVGKLTDAEITGLKKGSTELTFIPKEIRGGNLKVNIGTAGSITLLLQCLIPVALFAPERTSLEIIGGTDVAWSPPIDFYRYVFLPVLGCRIELELLRRGYYPEGGGKVRVLIDPSEIHEIKIEEGEVVKGISHSSNLPEHVPERQAGFARTFLEERGYEVEIEIETTRSISTGSGITLWCGGKSGSSLGRKGKRAENVGEEAAKAIFRELESDSNVDVYLADQLIPYMALSEEKSEIRVREITGHLETNIFVCEKILGTKFIVKKNGIVNVRRI
ncbi:MAG: RNA 3'-terminal phosphate cyclase [Candidatus Syntropharchaeia archaeon]